MNQMQLGAPVRGGVDQAAEQRGSIAAPPFAERRERPAPRFVIDGTAVVRIDQREVEDLGALVDIRHTR